MKELTSILILCKDNLKYTQGCIESILKHTSQIKTPYEIIVVDNGSQDGTRQYLKGLEDAGQIRAIYNKENLGFPKGNNQAATIAKGDYLLLLNNDTIATPNFLEGLLRCLKSDTKLAAVGPYSSYSSGYQQSPVPCTYRNNEELDKFAATYSQEDKYVDFLVFFCCLIRRDVWDEIGGLWEGYGLGLYDDNEWCWRVVEKGYKLKIANVFIHHYISSSFSKNQKAYADLMYKNQKLFLKRIGKYQTIGLSMIVGQNENPATFRKCLESVAPVVDSVNVVFNYKHFCNPIKLKRLQKVLSEFKDVIIRQKVVKFKDFSQVRNLSLDLCEEAYICWCDCDDLLQQPQSLRDILLRNKDVDAFRIHVISSTETKTQERILHPRLFKNHKSYFFQNACHEDIMFSMREHNAKIVTTNLEIRHTGNEDPVVWKKKNLRNLKLLKKDFHDNPHILIYYGLINCYMIKGGKRNWWRAIQLIDEALEKFKPEKDDAITPKLWVLRGACCMDSGEISAAKQAFHKAYDEYKHPEAAIALADIYKREKNYDKVIEILTPIYEKKTFDVSNIPIDLIAVELDMLRFLGDAWAAKGELKSQDKAACWKEAEQHYRECLSIKPDLQAADRLCQLLRATQRWPEASLLTIKMVNLYPSYHVGWFNLGQDEMLNNRPHTAKLFWQEVVRLKPDYVEAKHNLKTVNQFLHCDKGKLFDITKFSAKKWMRALGYGKRNE